MSDTALDTPLSAAGEFKRGYKVLIGAISGSALGIAALQIYAIPFFVGPLQAAFGWSRSQVSVAASCQALGLLISIPIYGRLCDRFGVRRVAPISIVLFAAMLFFTSRVSNLYALYAGYIGAAILGGGTSYGCYSRPVSAWFDKSRGLTLGLTMAGPGLMATLLPLTLPTVIERFGWRGGYFALGLLALSALLPIFFLLKDEPEVGATSASHGVPQRVRYVPPNIVNLSLGQAARTRQFWGIWIGVFVVSCVVVGFHIHLMGMLIGNGLTKHEAEHTIALFGVAVVIGRIAIGFIVDRVHAPFVAATVFGLTAIGAILLALEGPKLAVFFIICLGLSAGSEGDMLAYLTGRYFGLRSFAEIFSWLWSAMLIGVAVGPPVVGAMVDATKSYQTALWIGAALCVLVAMLFATLGRFPKPNESRLVGEIVENPVAPASVPAPSGLG